MTGLETAELLAEQGNKVLVVEMLDEIGKGIWLQNLLDVMGRLTEYGLEMLPSHKLKKITETKVFLEDLIKNTVIEKQVDYVVLSLGVRSNNVLVDRMKENFDNVKVIGDANEVGKIAHATRAGFVEAYNL